ncbi:MAG: hypothetical protein NTX45_18110 [Proteobacteria bacterium]|nr:hypothetical protein [Pseudomonadota bacterium]
MNTTSKRLIIRWPVAILLGLVCSFTALAHDHGDGYWRPRHPNHYQNYYGWQRPYYPPPPVYFRGPPRYMPPPPPVWREPPPVMRPPQALRSRGLEWP